MGLEKITIGNKHQRLLSVAYICHLLSNINILNDRRVNLFPGRKDLPGRADRNGAVGRDGGLGRRGWGTSVPGRDPGTSGCPHQSVADSLF